MKGRKRRSVGPLAGPREPKRSRAISDPSSPNPTQANEDDEDTRPLCRMLKVEAPPSPPGQSAASDEADEAGTRLASIFRRWGWLGRDRERPLVAPSLAKAYKRHRQRVALAEQAKNLELEEVARQVAAGQKPASESPVQVAIAPSGSAAPPHRSMAQNEAEFDAPTIKLEFANFNRDKNQSVKSFGYRLPLPSMSNKKKIFQCSQCDYTTNRTNNLNRHYFTMHTPLKEPLICCGLVFKVRADVVDHNKRVHADSLAFCPYEQCQQLRLAFDRKHLLDRHIQSVHSNDHLNYTPDGSAGVTNPSLDSCRRLTNRMPLNDLVGAQDEVYLDPLEPHARPRPPEVEVADTPVKSEPLADEAEDADAAVDPIGLARVKDETPTDGNE